MGKKIYIVPYDFTAVGEAAAEYANTLATKTGAGIELLYVAKNEDGVADAQQRFEAVVDGWERPEGAPTLETRVVVGSIFEDISKLASFEHAQLIVMGTHGAKGLQKLLGSHALKVITSSSIPFIVVQELTRSTNVEHIVVPLNLTKESIGALKFSVSLAKLFGADIHVVCPHETDEWLAKKIDNNITVAGKILDEAGVKHSAKILDSNAAFSKQVVDYATVHSCDLIAIAYYAGNLLPSFDTFTQAVITNHYNIPVLVGNVKEVGITTGGIHAV